MAVTNRANDIKASNLSLLRLALTVLAALLYPNLNDSELSTRQATAILALMTLFYIALALGVRTGILWVKVIFVTLIALTFILYVVVFPELHEPKGEMLLWAIGYFLEGWAAIIVTKDLLRKPEAADAGVAGGGYERPN